MFKFLCLTNMLSKINTAAFLVSFVGAFAKFSWIHQLNMDFMKGWNMMQFLMGRKKSQVLPKSKSMETSGSEEATHEKEPFIKTKETGYESKDNVWTEKDTNDLMDIVESVLNIVNGKLELVQGNEENENERLEELVESVQAINDEINSMMMLISDITYESFKWLSRIFSKYF
jgi:hypothetical protein